MKTQHYDFVFAGGGLAGLSLAYHLAQSPLRNRSMLIVDCDAKQRNDRTWCFWAMQPSPFDGLVPHAWDCVRVASNPFQADMATGAYRYKMIRGLDFYRFVHQALSALPNVTLIRGDVEGIDACAGGAQLSAGGEVYTGDWVFDSRINPAQFRPSPARYHYVQQHFKGWEIETPAEAFDRSVATLMDFRTPQNGAMRFFYVLPFSSHRALVEYVSLDRDDYDARLKAYIENVLGVRDYHVTAVEGGVSPLTDFPFPRRTGAHVMTIGVSAGRIKPTTGYAFQRIQQDSAAIVQSLVYHGHPFDVPADSRRYRAYDALMLDLMQHHGDQVEPIYSALFINNTLRRVFRFLDEQASPVENALLIASLPPQLFLRAIAHMLVSRIGMPTASGAGYRPVLAGLASKAVSAQDDRPVSTAHPG